jgi:hypothetical protein
MYPEAEAFKPERFLKRADNSTLKGASPQAPLDPRAFIFGFGKRSATFAYLAQLAFLEMICSIVGFVLVDTLLKDL